MSRRTAIVGLVGGATLVALGAAWGVRHAVRTTAIAECESILSDLDQRLVGPAPCSGRELEEILGQLDSRRAGVLLDWADWPGLRRRAAALDARRDEARATVAGRTERLETLLAHVGKDLEWTEPDLERAAVRLREAAPRFEPPDASLQQAEAFVARLKSGEVDAARHILELLRRSVPSAVTESPTLRRFATAVESRRSLDDAARHERATREAGEDRALFALTLDRALALLRIPDAAGALSLLEDAERRMHRPHFPLQQVRELVTHGLAGDEALVQSSLAGMRQLASPEWRDEVLRIESAWRTGRMRQRDFDEAERLAEKVARFQPLVSEARRLVAAAPPGYFQDRRNRVAPVVAGVAVIVDLSAESPKMELADAPPAPPGTDQPATVFCVVERKAVSYGSYFVSARLTYGYLVGPESRGEYMGPATGESAVIAVIDWPARRLIGWQSASAKPPESIGYSGGRSGFRARVDMRAWIRTIPEL